MGNTQNTEFATDLDELRQLARKVYHQVALDVTGMYYPLEDESVMDDVDPPHWPYKPYWPHDDAADLIITWRATRAAH